MNGAIEFWGRFFEFDFWGWVFWSVIIVSLLWIASRTLFEYINVVTKGTVTRYSVAGEIEARIIVGDCVERVSKDKEYLVLLRGKNRLGFQSETWWEITEEEFDDLEMGAWTEFE